MADTPLNSSECLGKVLALGITLLVVGFVRKERKQVGGGEREKLLYERDANERFF